ncbi:hypothetical protein P3X46_026778 [Hevea brasiliensis]|uniref:non-specific serine/threonine protein kinase n=1 Tax=Hevea brasiliensis TaxID=3981 RepID=A0ABQ9KXR1_HEVBR|nr:hypothetical protein P3X46_026778 [Hevea brasiliensis]
MVLAKVVSFLILLLCLFGSGNSDGTLCDDVSGNSDGTLCDDEVTALNAVIYKLGLVPTPTVSTDYCALYSGRRAFSIYIECNCNGTTCHITQIRTDSIDLSGGGIHEMISKLKCLKSLDLGSNQLSGSIPATIGDLQYLETLNLYKNLLTGPIPPSLGKLSSLKELRLYRNMLSNEIPKQLSNLSKLETLRLEQNQLSGHIPPELGNLLSLKQLTLDENQLIGTLPPELGKLGYLVDFDVRSNYLTGELNQSFAGLQNLQFFKVAGNNLTGRIPNYIAKWTALIYLNLMGNQFEGELPREIFNMKSLQYLLVSDLSNTSFSFPKEAKLSSIYLLVLRNCSINGPIPEYIGNWLSLDHLDLSFNNLAGGIPESFKNLTLTKLFLNRNRLTEILPPWIFDTVYNFSESTLDLTYNNFSKIEKPKNLLQELNMNDIFAVRDCQGKKYNSLFINCGGPNLTVDGNEYDGDLSMTNFAKDPKGKWAYTCSGDFWSTTSNSSDYHKNMTCGVSENSLYRTGRLCPVALSYYAFCLQDDLYNVTLHFAETVYTKEEDYSIMGKRVFDVYIQGKRQRKDFDIKRWSGGPNQEQPEVFPYTNVEGNLLQIHLYWAGKGSLDNPPALNGPLLSAISVIPSNPPSPRKKLTPGQIAGITLGSVFTPLLLLAFLWRWLRNKELDEIIKINVQGKVVTVTLRQVINATGNFNPKARISDYDGRFGEAYKAELKDPQIILVVKRISSKFEKKPNVKMQKEILKQQKENLEQRKEKGISKQQKEEEILKQQKEEEILKRQKEETQKEIFNLTIYRHDNLVQLHHRSSKEGLHLLIYEYMEGSLHQSLFESETKPVWKDRLNICLGIAKGLKYLHEENKFKIVHGNVTSKNIMLGKNYTAKLSDFGLAVLYDDEPFLTLERRQDLVTMAPECAYKPIAIEADVYSFGHVMLELVSGKPSVQSRPNEDVFLMNTAGSLKKQGRILDLVDGDSPMTSDDKDEAKKIIELAMKCFNIVPENRPKMSEIVIELEEVKNCLKPIPESRSTMSKIVGELEETIPTEEETESIQESSSMVDS